MEGIANSKDSGQTSRSALFADLEILLYQTAGTLLYMAKIEKQCLPDHICCLATEQEM